MRSKLEMTLTCETIGLFRSACIARGQSLNTAKAYSTDLRMLLQWAGTTEITRDEYEIKAQMWLNETRKDAAPKTTGRRLTSVRAFAKWIKLVTELDEYKAPTPARSMPHPLPEREDGLRRLLAVAKNHEQEALVGAMGYMGLRVQEALDFKTSWLDVDSMVLTVRGKGDKERIVPVSDKAWAAIRTAFIHAMMGDGYLIHMQDRTARKTITSMGRRAGLSRAISSHDLRATFATIMNDAGTNIRVVQELLGHASVSTTEIYTGVEVKAMREAVQF